MADLSNLLKRFEELPEKTESPYVVSDLSTDGNYFRFYMTSKALTKKALGAVSINADATYKLLWQGFPVLIVGTTDMEKKCRGL